MSKRLFITLFYSICYNCLVAQTTTIDSLKKLLDQDKDKFTNPGLYREIGVQYYRQGNIDTAAWYFSKGYIKAIKENSDYWSCKAAIQLGSFYTALASFDSAAKYLDIGFELLQKNNNDSLLAQYYNAYGGYYIYQTNYDKSAAYNLKAIEILERMGDKQPPNMYITSVSNMAICLTNENQLDKALVYYKKAIANKEQLHGAQIAALYFDVASLYSGQADYKSMKLYLDTASFYNKHNYNAYNEILITAGYGQLFQQTKQPEKALSYYLSSYKLSKEPGNENALGEAAVKVAGAYYDLNKTDAALPFLAEGVPLSIKVKNFEFVTMGYDLYKKIYAAKGDFKKAFTYAGLYQQFKDSSTNANSQETILNLERKYENQKKEKEIDQLKITNAENELAVVKRNRLLLTGGISAAAIMLLLGMMYRNSNHKKTIAEKEQKIQQEQIKLLEGQQQVISLQSMVNGQETERTRIAKDLHDGLGGLFSTVKMYFSTLEHQQKHLKENELFKKSYAMVDTAAAEVRRIAHNMMPEVLLKLGLANALKDLCDNISASQKINVSLQIHGMEKRLGPSTEIMLYRIVQELLNNILKHANASKAIVQFIQDNNRLSVTVEDNGKGFDLADADAVNKAGIETVKSRVHYLNGNMQIESQKDIGTTVMMDFNVAKN